MPVSYTHLIFLFSKSRKYFFDYKAISEPIDGEGNAYTRDLLYDKATNKQFITVQTKTCLLYTSER